MLRYLVDPIFQVLNTAGKPATGGYIEVYLHGTRDKYYCASDFNGTLHPFKIPLDSLGANIILADDANAYDIYVYNRYGSLLMSRYNVAPVQGGGSGGGDHIGKVHFLKAVSDDLADMRAPYSFWIVDLEKPNPNSPYGYDYAMAEEVIAQLSAGEVFVLSTYPTAPSAEEDLYIMGSSALQTWQGHTAVRIWFTRMFAANSPEYMYFTTIYTPSMYNNNPMAGGYPEGRMAILNWRGQQDSRSEFHFMPYTELSEVATSGDYNDLRNKPTIPAAQVQSDWSQSDNTQVDFIKNKPNLALKENVSNKVQTINDTSTTDYPSSKAVADFVNSSVATNTANFLGTLSESSLGLDYTATNAQIALALNVHSWDSTPTNNDYCFVSVNDPQTTDVDEYRRFKFNGSVWAYEYTLNNSSFTQAQWNSINSGIDSSDKAAYDAAVTLLSNHVNDHNNPHNVTAAQIGAESVSNKAQLVDITSTTDYPSSKAVADYVYQVAVVFNEKIQRGLNTSQTNSQAYSLIGTLNVTNSFHRGMMAFELFCCKQCSSPIRMTATFGYQADNNLTASYSRESARSADLTRYKLAWRFADDHTANAPKIEIWLIDTLETGADQRRCGCNVHMVDGIEWINGNSTTNTLPSGLTDFTPFYT